MIQKHNLNSTDAVILTLYLFLEGVVSEGHGAYSPLARTSVLRKTYGLYFNLEKSGRKNAVLLKVPAQIRADSPKSTLPLPISIMVVSFSLITPQLFYTLPHFGRGK